MIKAKVKELNEDNESELKFFFGFVSHSGVWSRSKTTALPMRVCFNRCCLLEMPPTVGRNLDFFYPHYTGEISKVV